MSPYKSVKRGKVAKQFRTWFLAVLVLVMAAMLIAGPRLFSGGKSTAKATMVAQAQTQEQPQTATEAPANATETKAPTPAEGTSAPQKDVAKEEAKLESHGEAVALPFGDKAWPALFIVLGAAILALIFGGIWLKKTMNADPGNERMESFSLQ